MDAEIADILGRASPEVLSRPKKKGGRPNARRPAEHASVLSLFGCQGDGSPAREDEPAPDACRACGSTDLLLVTSESHRRCLECDAIDRVVIDNERPAKRDVPKDSTSFSFKRLGHFNEWLAQIQGKEQHAVPDAVIARVTEELRKHNITNAAEVTASQVRSVLRKSKISRFYEHVPYILSRIRGVQEERMSAAMEEKLRAMFRSIQLPFIRHSPPDRKNFLSYGYVLRKFLQLLGEDRFSDNVTVLKSRDKLRAQDAIWKKMCAELDWEYVPSI